MQNHLWPTSGESGLYQEWVFFHAMSRFLWDVPLIKEFANAIVSLIPNGQQSLCAVNKKETRTTSTSNKGDSVPGCQTSIRYEAIWLKIVRLGTSNLPSIWKNQLLSWPVPPWSQTPVFLSHYSFFLRVVLRTQKQNNHGLFSSKLLSLRVLAGRTWWASPLLHASVGWSLEIIGSFSSFASEGNDIACAACNLL